MTKAILTFCGAPVRKFITFRQMGSYFTDVLMRGAMIGLLASAGILNQFILVSDSRLAIYIGIYLTAIFVWGMLIIKFIVCGKKVFGKTKLDIYFMILLTSFLFSVLLAENKDYGIFGSIGTWSYSVITLLSISVIYYILVLVCRYPRGMKWLNLAFVLSTLVSGSYHVFLALTDQKGSNLDYLSYMVISIPFCIGSIFVFRRIWLKTLAFVGLLASLFISAFYSVFLQEEIFMFGLGVLVLFIFFYFSFWINSRKAIFTVYSKIAAALKKLDLRSLKQVFQKREDLVVFLKAILVAIHIVFLALFCLTYYTNNISPRVKSCLAESSEYMEGVNIWIIGKNDLSTKGTSIEAFNVLKNYGLPTVVVFVVFLVYLCGLAGRLLFKFLRKGTFKDVVLLSSIFVTFVMILSKFLFSRFTPMVYLLFVFAASYVSIIDDLMRQDKVEVYQLNSCEGRLTVMSGIAKTISSIVVFGFTLAGMVLLFWGINKGVF